MRRISAAVAAVAAVAAASAATDTPTGWFENNAPS